MTGKTLKELNVQPGDVVYYHYAALGRGGNRVFRSYLPDGNGIDSEGDHMAAEAPYWHLVSRAVDTPKLWRDMTPEEKGALLLAHHEGKVIEFCNGGEWYEPSPCRWHPGNAYRVHPEPKVEAVIVYGSQSSINDNFHFGPDFNSDDTHRITFNLIDGEPDCDSVKMEDL